MGRHGIRTRGASFLTLLLLAGLTSCVPEEIEGPDLDPPVASIELMSGGNQTGIEGEELAEHIVARALLSDGRVALNREIRAVIHSGNGAIESIAGRVTIGGTGTSLPFYGSVDLIWTLGPASEAQVLRIFVPGFETTASVDVTATVLPREEPSGR